MTDDEVMAALRQAMGARQGGIQLGAPVPGGQLPGMPGGLTGAGLMPPATGGPPGGPAPQLGSLIGQQPGGMGGPGGITATPLPPPGMPQSPMTPATPMGGPMATGGGTGMPAPGAPVPQPRPFVPFGQSSNLADYFSQPRPAATAGMAPQQARQGLGMGPPAPSFGQTHYLMDYLARMFGRG